MPEKATPPTTEVFLKEMILTNPRSRNQILSHNRHPVITEIVRNWYNPTTRELPRSAIYLISASRGYHGASWEVTIDIKMKDKEVDYPSRGIVFRVLEESDQEARIEIITYMNDRGVVIEEPFSLPVGQPAKLIRDIKRATRYVRIRGKGHPKK